MLKIDVDQLIREAGSRPKNLSNRFKGGDNMKEIKTPPSISSGIGLTDDDRLNEEIRHSIANGKVKLAEWLTELKVRRSMK